jgi:hypothetical protein
MLAAQCFVPHSIAMCHRQLHVSVVILLCACRVFTLFECGAVYFFVHPTFCGIVLCPRPCFAHALNLKAKH